MVKFGEDVYNFIMNQLIKFICPFSKVFTLNKNRESVCSFRAFPIFQNVRNIILLPNFTTMDLGTFLTSWKTIIIYLENIFFEMFERERRIHLGFHFFHFFLFLFLFLSFLSFSFNFLLPFCLSANA